MAACWVLCGVACGGAPSAKLKHVCALLHRREAGGRERSRSRDGGRSGRSHERERGRDRSRSDAGGGGAEAMEEGEDGGERAGGGGGEAGGDGPVSLDAPLSQEEIQMMAAMGVPFGFDTTQGRHVEDERANVSGSKVKSTRSARQFMNRRGGFNRPLPAERTNEKVMRD
ncbi:MAG: hypothetical protein J3K34DRAFT_268919 [Monoraphidium minutum]|nr:MAG: hypothetical protein J3K34DRAFT_268919 [Monoraphidium minutum]